MRQLGCDALFEGGPTHDLVADLIDRLLSGPKLVGVMQQQCVHLERIRAGAFRHNLLEQPSNGFQQYEAIAVSDRRAVLVERLGDCRKPWLDLAEGERERRRSHALGRKSSRVRTNSAVASTCGQCPTGSSFSRALTKAASSRDAAIGSGSNVPCTTREGGRGTRDAVSLSLGRRS